MSSCKVPSPVKLPSAAECVRFERESFGALHQMMSTLSDAERAETWREIERELRQFETADGLCRAVRNAGRRRRRLTELTFLQAGGGAGVGASAGSDPVMPAAQAKPAQQKTARSARASPATRGGRSWHDDARRQRNLFDLNDAGHEVPGLAEAGGRQPDLFLVVQRDALAHHFVDAVGHRIVAHREQNFSGIAPGIDTIAISPSHVLHSHPLRLSFCTQPARSPVE